MLGVSRAGRSAKPVPGHEVAVIDDRANVVPDATRPIAVQRPRPVMFSGITWQQRGGRRSQVIGD